MSGSANAENGVLSARMARDFRGGVPSLPIQTATAGIEETLQFTASATQPVTIIGRLYFAGEAVANIGNALAVGRLELGQCRVQATRDVNGGTGPTATCNVFGGSAEGNAVRLTLPPESVTPDLLYDVSGMVAASLSSNGLGTFGEATAEAQVSFEIQGTSAYEFLGPRSFTVPEAASGAAGCAALGMLAGIVARARSRR